MNHRPMAKPADIYAAVAEKTIAALKVIASEKPHTAEIPSGDEEQQKALLQVQAAKWWLDFGITRKVTKRNCTNEPVAPTGHPVTPNDPRHRTTCPLTNSA